MPWPEESQGHLDFTSEVQNLPGLQMCHVLARTTDDDVRNLPHPTEDPALVNDCWLMGRACHCSPAINGASLRRGRRSPLFVKHALPMMHSAPRLEGGFKEHA